MTKCALTPDSDGLWLGIALLLVGLALVGVWQTPERINADCALRLQEAELLLNGAVPYLDFVDIDRPLITYLNVLPVGWPGRSASLRSSLLADSSLSCC